MSENVDVSRVCSGILARENTLSARISQSANIAAPRLIQRVPVNKKPIGDILGFDNIPRRIPGARRVAIRFNAQNLKHIQL